MKTIDVYVRLGRNPKGFDDEGSRHISFNPPDEISQAELLNDGWAIDGNMAVIGISAYTEQDTGNWISLPEALRDAQRDIVQRLKSKGYDVTFK